MLYLEEEKTSPAIIKVIGVGGGGMNAVTRMVHSKMTGVDFIVMNTDEQVLLKSPVEVKIQLGNKVTRGMGAGGDPELGEKAAIEDKERIVAALKGADMVFVTAGMGGGTGTGAAPIIAAIAKELKCLVVGVVTVPFSFEGKRRAELAKQGIEQLRANVDTLITIRNDSIFQVVDKNTPFDKAFQVIDDILLNGVRGISDIINHPGIINVDFADVKTIMKDTGDAILGVGEGSGETRVSEAVEQAINNTLLEDSSIQGAKSLLINVTGGSDLTIHEWNEVSQIITAQADPDANIIIGLNEDKSLSDQIRVTVIATGFNKRGKQYQREQKVVGSEETISPMVYLRKSEEKESGFSKDTEAPRGIRQTNRSFGAQKQSSPFQNYGEDYDIPTFLRKKND
ncbi:cell division protein FtsZ [Leptospira biflexa]|jgi:cell division protein FtsZ|uniref:cell division protein FtsZ n=1 Tax=Leptospira biflexa TaxID=172 RepID=UPI001084281D|nr:cell division protein FtsZ [Leptospira biflexa]TGM37783.1 cell division protein FtsZ [Leptospira biflexa]TGM41117.1 cell division protein FtsZ [Leptospira biflexa]TGM55485.1 cell division protein FtsZ [Leptospira biflexa]